MTWNYRVVHKSEHKDEGLTIRPVYEIHEVFYDKDGEITSWSPCPSSPVGETLEELREDIDKMLGAFTRGVLDEEDLYGPGPIDEMPF